MFNVLAPAVIEDHITAGMTMRLDDNQEFNIAGMVAPSSSVKGANPFDGGCYTDRNRDVSVGNSGRLGMEILS